MVENGFYKIKSDFVEIINHLGGRYADQKERPVFCCIEDKYVKSLFWAIPTSDISHRSPAQISKIESWCKESGIRSAYYHIGYTNRPAIYRISSCFPITDKYIDGEYISQGIHLVLKNKNEIAVIRQKLNRILFDESIHPNKYEQHITDILNYLVREISADKGRSMKAPPMEAEHTPFNDLLVSQSKTKESKSKTVELDLDR